MPLLPDPADIRAVADRIGRHAAATRARADVLAAALAKGGWHGVAATAFELSAQPVIDALRAGARELDRAAAALRTHAHNVETVLADLRRIGVDLRTSGSDVVRLLQDGADPSTLVHHPEVLVKDGVAVVKDGGRLVVDGAETVGHVAKSAYHGIESGIDSALSLVGG